MSEHYKSLGEMNIEEYLHHFIETYLLLTFKEEKLLNDYTNIERMQEKLRRAQEKAQKKKNKTLKDELMAKGLKICKSCKKVLPIEDFYNQMGLCKKCYNRNRQKKRFCKECLQIKPVTEFKGGDHICKQCKENW